MQKEVDSAVRFICGLLRARSLSLDLLETFSTVLCQVMYGRYQDHWFPDKPRKGCAYRCVRINDRIVDPLILLAAAASGLSESDLLPLLPSQLTIWIDPEEVAYRIGEDGSIGVIYDAHAAASPAEDSDGESAGPSGSSVGSSPSASPVPHAGSSSSDDDAASPVPRPSALLSCRQAAGAGQRVAGGGGGAAAAVGSQAPGQYSVLIASS